MAIEVAKVELKTVQDASGLDACIARGQFTADEVIAVIGKTEGNGGVNDFTRILADQAFRRALQRHGKRSEAEIATIPMVWSGGCDGVITPHATVFARNGKTGPASKSRLAIGTAMSAELLPEDIGRPAMVEKVAQAVKAAMRDAAIDDPKDVHFVQTKTPLLTIDSVRRANLPRSQPLLLGCLVLLGGRAHAGAGRASRQQGRCRRALSHRPCGDAGCARHRRHLRRHRQCRPRSAGAPPLPRSRGSAGELLHKMRGRPPRHAAWASPDHARRFRCAPSSAREGRGRRRSGGSDRGSGGVRISRCDASGPARRRAGDCHHRCGRLGLAARGLLGLSHRYGPPRDGDVTMNKHVSTLRRVMSALAAIVVLAAPAAAQDKVKVGVFPVSSSLPYFVALERGFFKEQNLEPEMVRLIGGPPNVAAMITNQIDSAAVLVTIEGMNANIKKPGVAMYISVNSQNKTYQMEQFVVRKGFPATSLKDLKGAKIMSAPGPAN